MEGTTAAGENALRAVFVDVSRTAREPSRLEHRSRIVVLRNITVEAIDVFLKHHLHPSGIRPEVLFGGYGTMTQDILRNGTPFGRSIAEADVLVLSLALEELDPLYGSPGWRAERARQTLEELFRLMQSASRATIVVNTFIPPLYAECGVVPAADCTDVTTQVGELNHFIVEHVRSEAPRFCLADWNRYLAIVGADGALDDRGRYLWKAPFKRAFLDLYAADIARVARLLSGKSRKCLVLDCDNTLWGGVIGEDGVDGIKLDRNDYPGKAYHDFQMSVLRLADRGLLIALCSKNNEEDVFEVLDRHPACLLKRTHVSSFRLNWRDKATNLREIAHELNIGLDALVFVDDNPAECELARSLLPDVAVLQVPEKLYELPALLMKEGLFNGLTLTAEDRKRAQLYETEHERKSARSSFHDLDAYLRSLETVASIRLVCPSEIARAAQLTQKTNQFNLTTRRYAEQDIAEFSRHPDIAVYTLSAKDRFGDLGLVGVMIAKKEGDVGHIDTLLLSCRALGRNLEQAIATCCLERLTSRWKIRRWHSEYIPTRKNAQARDFWQSIGFGETGRQEDRCAYALNASDLVARVPDHILIGED